ncbi:MAG: serine/threonine protein kinase, partial [Planctomycetales bacterium]|nr:serine/threonine protein kinase [Planctomycetales bacterium]
MPTQFGRFRVERLLGQGAMGAVYFAWDTQLERAVALKVPRFTGAEDSDVVQRLLREAKAAASLDHPHICRVYDVGNEAGTAFIAMQFIEGRPLSDYIAPGHFQDERRSVDLVRKLASALVEAHAKGIIHRDLKPANILVNERGEPILMDFGLARRADSTGDGRATQAGMLIGSPAYMSPEQANGEIDKIGPWSDLYSLGVLLFELLTNQLPFQGSVLTILSQIATKEPPLPSSFRPGLDPRLDVICCRMLAKKIADRHGSMADVASELQTWMTSSSGPDPRVRTANIPSMPTHLSSGPRGPDHDPGAEPTKDSIGGLVPIAPKVTAARKSTTLTPDDISRQKQRVQKLLAEHNYDAAIPILTKLGDLKGTQFQETVAWAKSTLPATKEKQQKLRDQSAQACEKARWLLMKYDYSGAAQVVELIPAGARNDEVRQLLSQANDSYEECLLLRQDIDESLKRKKYSRLRSLLERYLKLKPDSPKLERLLRNLEKNHPARAVANFQETQTYYDVAGRLIEPKELIQYVVLLTVICLAVYHTTDWYFTTYLASTRSDENSGENNASSSPPNSSNATPLAAQNEKQTDSITPLIGPAPSALPLMGSSSRVRIKSRAVTGGEQWLAGGPASGPTVRLVSDPELSGATWELIRSTSGNDRLQCVLPGPDSLWLDGDTVGAKTSLLSDLSLSGTNWERVELTGGINRFRNRGGIEGPRWLAINPGSRTTILQNDAATQANSLWEVIPVGVALPQPQIAPAANASSTTVGADSNLGKIPDPHRRFAHWVILSGGEVELTTMQKFNQLTMLPPAPFTVRGADLVELKAIPVPIDAVAEQLKLTWIVSKKNSSEAAIA